MMMYRLDFPSGVFFFLLRKSLLPGNNQPNPSSAFKHIKVAFFFSSLILILLLHFTYHRNRAWKEAILDLILDCQCLGCKWLCWKSDHLDFIFKTSKDIQWQQKKNFLWLNWSWTHLAVSPTLWEDVYTGITKPTQIFLIALIFN